MSDKAFERALRDFAIDASLPAEAKAEFIEVLELVQRCRYDIVAFAVEMLGMQLNEFQIQYLTRTTTPRSEWAEKFGVEVEDIGGMLYGRNIACPSNQVGKTVLTAIKHLWMNYYKVGLDVDESLIEKAHYQTLNISPQSRQTKACYSYVKEIMEERFVIDEEGKKRTNKLHPIMKGFIVGDNLNLGEIRFINKSIMYSVPVGHDQASSLAGGQFGFISYDEAAQSHHLKNELGAKILSRLIKYGVGLDLISTPEVDSPSHQDYLRMVKLGLQGKEGWWAMTGHLDQNRFISTAQRTRIKADLLATDKKKYRQVVKGEFVTGGKRFFDVAEVDQLWRLTGKTSCVQGRKYILVADWGMSDTGDPSIFYVIDYTEWIMKGKLYLVNHEEITGGTPYMQFALLRSLYDGYTWYIGDDTAGVKPVFLMDAKALGGVTIKKLLSALNPKSFEIEKDEALLLLKNELCAGRHYEERDDGEVVENNPNFGNILCYYIEELNTQLGNYHIEDEKLTQDHVMTLMMGVSYIVKKFPRSIAGKRTVLNPLASYQAAVTRAGSVR